MDSTWAFGVIPIRCDWPPTFREIVHPSLLFFVAVGISWVCEKMRKSSVVVSRVGRDDGGDFWGSLERAMLPLQHESLKQAEQWLGRRSRAIKRRDVA